MQSESNAMGLQKMSYLFTGLWDEKMERIGGQAVTMARVKPYLDEDIPASGCLQYLGLKRIERNKRVPLAWVQDFCDGFTSWPPNTMSVISKLERRLMN